MKEFIPGEAVFVVHPTGVVSCVVVGMVTRPNPAFTPPAGEPHVLVRGCGSWGSRPEPAACVFRTYLGARFLFEMRVAR